jgi:hypothetical protein
MMSILFRTLSDICPKHKAYYDGYPDNLPKKRLPPESDSLSNGKSAATAAVISAAVSAKAIAAAACD